MVDSKEIEINISSKVVKENKKKFTINFENIECMAISKYLSNVLKDEGNQKVHMNSENMSSRN